MHHRLDNDSELFIGAMRGLAAFAVLVTHSVDLGVAGVFGWELPSNPPAWRLVRSTIGHGAFAVWIFFVLSGLCIHLSIARSVASNTFSWRHYALARITRLYPLFLVGLALAITTFFAVASLEEKTAPFSWPQLGASLVMLHGFTGAFPTYDQSWSLSNEMIYYAVWPVALFFCGRSGNRAARFSMLLSLAGLTVILVVWRVFHRLEGSTAVKGMWSITVLFPLWIAGAWLLTNWQTMSERVTPRNWLGFVPLCLLSLGVLAIVRYEGNNARALDLTGLTGLPGILLLVAGGRHLRLSRFPWAPGVCRWLGEFSYPCYILHYQVMLLLDRFLLGNYSHGTAQHPLSRSFVLLVLTLLVTTLIGPVMERSVMAWRTRVLARDKGKVNQRHPSRRLASSLRFVFMAGGWFWFC